ncbi:hypothetical protein HZS_146 [Henneguya salminicola]|nr:hypothetical protein HZS_146 [Henneguya salminicola]
MRKSNLNDLIEAISWVNQGYSNHEKNNTSSISMVDKISYSLMPEKQYKQVTKTKYRNNKKIYNSIPEKSSNSRVHHNLLEKHRYVVFKLYILFIIIYIRREAMRQLLKKLKELLPTSYRNDRMSTAKILTAASTFIKEWTIKIEKTLNEARNEHNRRLYLINQIKHVLTNGYSQLSSLHSDLIPIYTISTSDSNSKNGEIDSETRDSFIIEQSFSYHEHACVNNEEKKIIPGTKINV